MTHNEVDGTQIGQHPVVFSFLKGIFNNRPPAPRYSSTYDVYVVLNYIMNFPALFPMVIAQTCDVDGIV